jgi:predicted lysophospholipase L1 biosynthesis ABC-type transport system permease subunit
VVHAGVERFSPSQTPDPKVTGFFYSMTITAHDSLLGGAVGNYALLTMPDKTVRKVALGPRHTATVTNLPLGDYQVQVTAGSASISPVAVHLSRDETANLVAISRTDIAIVCGALVAGIAGAPLLSRTRRKRALARVRRVSRLVRRGAGETGKEVSLCCPSASGGPPPRRFRVHWPRPV